MVAERVVVDEMYRVALLRMVVAGRDASSAGRERRAARMQLRQIMSKNVFTPSSLVGPKSDRISTRRPCPIKNWSCSARTKDGWISSVARESVPSFFVPEDDQGHEALYHARDSSRQELSQFSSTRFNAALVTCTLCLSRAVVSSVRKA